MGWTEDYRPHAFAELKGNTQSIEKVRSLVKNSALLKKKAILLHGPPGTGKTTLAQIIARELDAELFELNASDLRNKAKLQAVLKPAIEQQSLTKKSKILLIDEVDGISATDRGGLTELLSLIATTSYPIILTANDIWNQKFSSLRQKCELVPMKEIDLVTMKNILETIAQKEKISIKPEILTKIAAKAKGDIRAAINDLQTAAHIENPEEVLFDERNKRTDIFHALRAVFKGKPNEDTLRVYDAVDMPIDEIILWVEENIPEEYQGLALVKAIDLLSKADVFKGRIYKQQYWRFLLYENVFLSYGIAAAKDAPKSGFTQYKKPSRILKIWLNNQRTAKKKSIARKYASHVHIGEKRAMSEFPIIKQILRQNERIQQELELEKEEIEYLLK